MPFVTPVRVEPVDATRWALVAPLVYRGQNDLWTIEAGTITDLATSPKAVTPFIPRYGAYTGAAIVHDRLCEIAHGLWPEYTQVSRRDADGIFRRIMREEGVSFPRRWTMWAAVRVGGRLQGATLGDLWRIALVAVTAGPPYAIPAVVNQAFLVLEWLVIRAFRAVGLE